jgi:predicted DNA-binding transcriptional regulator AlpA
MHDAEKLINTRAAADLLSVSEWTLRSWRATGNPTAPPFIRVGPKAVRYSRSALAAWAASRQGKPDESLAQKSHDPGSHKDCRGRGDR